MDPLRKFAPTKDECLEAHINTVKQVRNLQEVYKSKITNHTPEKTTHKELELYKKYCKKTQEQKKLNAAYNKIYQSASTDIENLEPQPTTLPEKPSPEISYSDKFFQEVTAQDDDKNLDEIIKDLNSPHFPKILQNYKNYLNKITKEIHDFFFITE